MNYELILSAYIFVVGLLFGSFFNVCGTRIYKKKSLLSRSRCEKCHHKLGIIDLIPVFNYIINKGKCAYCGTKYPVRYSVFEIITGVVFVLLYQKFGLSADFFIYLLFFSYIITITISDIEYKEIPFELTIFFYLIILSIFTLTGNFVTPFLNSLYAFALMFVLKAIGDFVFKKESLGGGDVKAFAVIGLMFSFDQTLMILYIACIVGVIYGLYLKKIKKENEFYFVPAFAISSLLVLLFDLSYINLF